MTKKKYKQFKKLKQITPLYLTESGIPITVFIHSNYHINERYLNEKNLFAEVTVRMIDPKYTKLIERQ